MISGYFNVNALAITYFQLQPLALLTCSTLHKTTTPSPITRPPPPTTVMGYFHLIWSIWTSNANHHTVNLYHLQPWHLCHMPIKPLKYIRPHPIRYYGNSSATLFPLYSHANPPDRFRLLHCNTPYAIHII